MTNEEIQRKRALARIAKTLGTMRRVAANDDIHAHVYVRDVTRLLKMEAEAYDRGREVQREADAQKCEEFAADFIASRARVSEDAQIQLIAFAQVANQIAASIRTEGQP